MQPCYLAALKMLRPYALATLIALLPGLAAVQEALAAAPVPLSTAVKNGAITLAATGNGRDALTLTLNNPTPPAPCP